QLANNLLGLRLPAGDGVAMCQEWQSRGNSLRLSGSFQFLNRLPEFALFRMNDAKQGTHESELGFPFECPADPADRLVPSPRARQCQRGMKVRQKGLRIE